jgi:hypothetical protein
LTAQLRGFLLPHAAAFEFGHPIRDKAAQSLAGEPITFTRFENTRKDGRFRLRRNLLWVIREAFLLLRNAYRGRVNTAALGVCVGHGSRDAGLRVLCVTLGDALGDPFLDLAGDPANGPRVNLDLFGKSAARNSLV